MRIGIGRHVLVLAMLMALAVGIGEGAAEDAVARGDSLWKQRDSIEKTRQAIAVWEEATKIKRRDPDLWAKIARGYFWLGELTPVGDKKKRMDACTKGIKAAQKAIDIEPEHLPARFWRIVLHGRYIEARGLLSGFDFGESIKTTLLITSRDETYYNGGIYRFWGRVMWSVPPVIGRFIKLDIKDSIETYEQALRISPHFLETGLYMTDSYIKMGEKDKARQTLEWMVKADPEKMPEYAPENRLYQRMAKELLNKHFGG